MERVTFLVEDTGERLSCLLNPESLVIRRRAGIRPRKSASGCLSSRLNSDDSFIFTGGGCTSIELNLVFDVTMTGSSVHSQDVRDYTRPLWDLAENVVVTDGKRRLRCCYFCWDKNWNLRCVISSIAERFDFFTAEGVPRRSWMRMRMLRVDENDLAQKPVQFPYEVRSTIPVEG